MTFTDLGLSPELLKAVETAGYTVPTPIQAQAIPPVLMMKDIIGIAQTGTGKTASFVLPMIDILASGRRRARMPRSLILEPTRELAAQVAENFEKYGKNHDLRMALLILPGYIPGTRRAGAKHQAPMEGVWKKLDQGHAGAAGGPLPGRHGTACQMHHVTMGALLLTFIGLARRARSLSAMAWFFSSTSSSRSV